MFLRRPNFCTKLGISILLIALFVLTDLNAQITPISSHYFRNMVAFNPAFAGQNENLNLIAGYRYQWAQLPGAPQNIYLNGDIYVPQVKGGIGLGIFSQKIGVQSLNKISLNYAFIQPIGNVKLSVGLRGGMIFSKLDGSKLITPNGDYQNGTNHEDPILPNVITNSLRPDLGMGIAIKHENFNFGIAYNNIIDLSDKFKEGDATLLPNYESPLNVYGSLSFGIGKDFEILPSFAINTDFRNLQTEITAMTSWRKIIYFGFSARGYNKNTFESLIPVVGANVWKNISVFYSYDVNINGLNIGNNGSHEVSLGYSMPVKQLYKSPKLINNPRFL
jgi:type IX secretion system PorP/SprF family membrane protein